jgi:hypothetical protein
MEEETDRLKDIERDKLYFKCINMDRCMAGLLDGWMDVRV